MSAMAAPSGGGRSILNPNAPLFIPAALQQVEDFSPEWWELVKTTPWFRDHWFRQHQDQENFDGEEEEDDVVNLLPDSFELGIEEDFLKFEKELEEYGAFGDATQEQYGLVLDAVNDKVKFGLETDAEALMKRLSLKSPKNGVSTKTLVEPAKYKEKPAQVVSPKFTPRRIIHQPR
ncbi:hypothetical protein HPP92_012127 [Vanilla planifolia]|uniref:Uncharacterized protein n=1 Tax=Vanilla planifolia TaxID=51239 RepID=A0A835V457_VANPL|nr:hypothetical protein HPP92_012127 [Vanilla planifolia]